MLTGEWVKLLPGSGDFHGYGFSRAQNERLLDNTRPRLPLPVHVAFDYRHPVSAQLLDVRLDDDGGVSGLIEWRDTPWQVGDQVYCRVAPEWTAGYTDPQTGERIGSALTSVSLTNDAVPSPWDNELRSLSLDDQEGQHD